MTQTEVEKGWRRDRVSLVICKSRNEALVSFYEDLKVRLSSPEE